MSNTVKTTSNLLLVKRQRFSRKRRYYRWVTSFTLNLPLGLFADWSSTDEGLVRIDAATGVAKIFSSRRAIAGGEEKVYINHDDLRSGGLRFGVDVLEADHIEHEFFKTYTTSFNNLLPQPPTDLPHYRNSSKKNASYTTIDSGPSNASTSYYCSTSSKNSTTSHYYN